MTATFPPRRSRVKWQEKGYGTEGYQMRSPLTMGSGSFPNHQGKQQVGQTGGQAQLHAHVHRNFYLCFFFLL